MAPSLMFDPDDLAVAMPEPAGYDKRLGQENLAAKHGRPSASAAMPY